MDETQSEVSVPGLMSALDQSLFREKLSLIIRNVMEQDILGRKADSYDVDKVAWLAAAVTSSSYVQTNMKKAVRCKSPAKLMSFALNAAAVEGLILEFGVFSGKSINHIASSRPHQKIYGFDSFQGLPERWRKGFDKGKFSVEQPPKVLQNVELVIGWFNQTLPSFCDGLKDETIALLHIDCDLYSSAVTVLSELKTRIVPGTIIVFDEYLNYPEWEEHEIRAFSEFCRSSRRSYEYIAIVPHLQQVAVRITA